MRALVQRVTQATVNVGARVAGAIGPGLLVFVCAMRGDDEADAEWLAGKIARLRIFRDGDGRMNRSLLDIGGAALVVSQFTLSAETNGNRPGFSTAAAPAEGEHLYRHFCGLLRQHGPGVETGEFGADMTVALVNDGPVTIWLDSRAR